MRVNLGKGLLVLRTTTTLLFHLHITAHNLLLIHISILEKCKEIKCRVRHKIPWVPEVFLACGGKFRCWPKADTSSTVGRSREKNLWHGAVLFTVPVDL